MPLRFGEDVTETLEVIPRQWKVIQTVREKFTCRDCEKLSQPPAPYHAAPRGWAGPNLLATIVFEKYGQHQPLNRQSERYARERVELSVATLADQGLCCKPDVGVVSQIRTTTVSKRNGLDVSSNNRDRPLRFSGFRQWWCGLGWHRLRAGLFQFV